MVSVLEQNSLSFTLDAEQLVHVFVSAKEAMFVTNSDGLIAMVNCEFTKLTGLTSEKAIGMSPRIFSPGLAVNDPDIERIWVDVEGQGFWRGESTLHKADGTNCPIWLSVGPVNSPAGEFCGHFGIASDISGFRVVHDRILRMAHYDPLTHLPNRNLLDDRMKHAIILAKRKTHEVSVLFVDLDRFKYVNDTYGHDAGDAVLKAVASRLKTCVRESDTVSRLGGDEFVIMLPETGRAGAAVVATKVLNELHDVFPVQDTFVSIGCSIGISVYPEDGMDALALINAADKAMYRSKHGGRGRYAFHEEAISA